MLPFLIAKGICLIREIRSLSVLLGLVYAAHGEGDAAAFHVDAGDGDAHVLMHMHLAGGGDAALGHLGDVDEAVLVDAQVNEGAKLRHVGHDAVQLHALAQVLDVVDVVVKLPHLNRRARVATGFLKLGHDIAQGGLAHVVGQVAPRVDFVTLGLVLNQVTDAAAAVLGHALYQGISLGMHCAIVQRVVALGNAQEACCLLKRLGPQFGHLQQLLT